MTSLQSPFTLSGRASRQVDGALVRARWVLGLAALVLLVIGAGSLYLSSAAVAWLLLLLAFNLTLFFAVRGKRLPARLPLWQLIGDLLLFGLLPYLSTATSPLLILFGLFPTLVAAIRFGPALGAGVALLLILPYEALSVAGSLFPSLHAQLPFALPPDINLVSAGLPVIALFGAVVLVGYLAQHEREAAAGDTAVELQQLRRAMAGAKLFFESTDTFSSSLSYSRVLDAMLEAGVAGMPAARKEDGPPVGLVLLFETDNTAKQLHIVAWRHLDRADTDRRIPGRSGAIGQTLEGDKPVTFTEIASDPELSAFATLRRCRAGVCYPLQAGLDLYGVVIFATPTPRVPTEQHLQLMRAFTNQAAVAFQNARLYASLREERDHIINAEASARAKLARDLHDGPTQSIAALAMRLDYIRMLLDKDPEKAKAEFEAARESAVRTGKELRELLFTLRPLTLETQGLSATLNLWCQRLRDNEGVPLNVDAGDLGADFDPNVAGTVFAVIEEAVNNARKYGGGAPIRVRVGRQNGTLLATVEDEGPGFDVAQVDQAYDQRGSLGLVNMRERARLLDGRLSIDSEPGRGTRVTLSVPIRGQAA